MLTRVPIVAVLLLAVLALVGGTAEAQQCQMKLQSLLNTGHMAADPEVWFTQEVEKRSNGRIKIFYPTASLGFGGARIMTVVPFLLVLLGAGVLPVLFPDLALWLPRLAM